MTDQKTPVEFDKISTIAVVGLSDKPDRSSFGVAEYLQQFFTIIPVNPALTKWQGLESYPSVSAIPSSIQIDLVDVFRRPEHIPAVLDDIMKRGGVRYLWFQQGIVHDEAAERATQAGMTVVQDSCLAVVHAQHRKRNE